MPIVKTDKTNIIAEEKATKKITFGKKKGFTGTDIYAGYLDVDYSPEWNVLSSKVALIQKMIDGDGTTSAILDAIKTPLASAKYFIEECDEVDNKTIQYAKDMIFKYQPKGFQYFLSEMLTFLEYGFCVFEKVPMIIDGTIYYDLQIRVQSSIEKWTIDGKPWIDGHPAGITQLVSSTDETETQFEAQIPWDDILLFSHQRIGNNFEGKSILRRMNIHFKMKQMLYKISIIAAERFGIGIPYAKHKVGVNPDYVAKLEEMLSNIRTNEQAYMVLSEHIKEFGIMTPGSNSEKASIDSLIKHHDRKMYDSVLAGFLNLTSGEGGSNALSQDQSSFFLRGLQSLADYYCETINQTIKEGVELNFGKQEKYPRLICTDVDQVNIKEHTEAISTAKEKGVVTWTAKDEDKFREQVKMLPIEQEERERLIKEKEEMASKINKAENDNTDKVESNDNKKDNKSLSEKKNLFFATIKKRERTFLRNIGDYENYLESEYTNYLTLFKGVEKTINKYLKEEYKKLDTKRIDGVLTIAGTAKNTRKESEMIRFVDIEIKKLKSKVINSKIQNRLFDTTRKAAIKGLQENDKHFSDTIIINEAQFNSFVKGYTSNAGAVLYNDARRVKENITLNFGSRVELDLAVAQTENKIFNRNILRLSTITHARGAYNMIQYNDNVKNGFAFFKIAAPKKRIKDLSPSGMMAKWLWLILTAAEINRRANKETDGKNTDAISGLNLHHNAFVYYYPISSNELEEEKKIAREQRAELKTELELTF